jgi:acyl-CoA thioester hydrolase
MPHVLFKYQIIIFDDDIDLLAHVNNASYIKWIQSAVVAHWEHNASPLLQANYFWVAMRHEIDYKKPTFRKDELYAETVLGEVRAVVATYKTTIKRGEEVIAKSVSTWCCIDPQTHRPKRIAPDILTAFGK